MVHDRHAKIKQKKKEKDRWVKISDALTQTIKDEKKIEKQNTLAEELQKIIHSVIIKKNKTIE